MTHLYKEAAGRNRIPPPLPTNEGLNKKLVVTAAGGLISELAPTSYSWTQFRNKVPRGGIVELL